MTNWIYDERGGIVAVYAGKGKDGTKELDCLDLPDDSFIYVRHWERKPEGLGFERIPEDCKIGRLVAAAPDLLSAAKEALTWLSGDRCCNCCHAVEDEGCHPGCIAGKLREAIAKAEGSP